MPATGINPYAAGQSQLFKVPSYSETYPSGGGFGLTYSAMSSTDVRNEVGARFDSVATVGGDMPLVLRGSAAWAHDWVSNPALGATFETEPEVGFIVTARRIARFGPDLGGRRTAHHARMDADGEIQRRLCARRSNLQRLRNIAVYVVTSSVMGYRRDGRDRRRW